MRPTILQMLPLSDYLDARLAEHFQIVNAWEYADQNAILAAHGTSISGIATAAMVGVPETLLTGLPQLRVVSSRGVGMDRIDLRSAQARGVHVAGTFGTLSDCVADLAFALLMDVARQVSAADRYVRRQAWSGGLNYPLSTRVSGKRLGIVGLGEIGRRVARRAGGFDMSVAYTGRAEKAGVGYPFFPSAEALAEWADFLVVTASGGAETRHMISSSVLDALGAGGYLVNVARGSLVDEEALVDALLQNRIAGAGLDVYENEPAIPQALLGLDNVVLVPHIGSATQETRRAMEDLVVENLLSFYSSGQLVTPAF